MGRPLTDIPVPEDAPGPDDSIIAEKYRGRMVIYSTGDSGWESHIEIDIESPWAIINVQKLR